MSNNHTFKKILLSLIVDRPTFILFSGSIVLHIILWFLRDSLVEFNTVPLYIGLLVIIINFSLTLALGQREKLIGYLFGGSALIAQLFLIILIVQAGNVII